MSQLDKLKRKFASMPSDFKWDELKKFLESWGYKLASSGKTGGSRVRFTHDKHPPIVMHKPHPKPVLKKYQLRQIKDTLIDRGQL